MSQSHNFAGLLLLSANHIILQACCFCLPMHCSSRSTSVPSFRSCPASCLKKRSAKLLAWTAFSTILALASSSAVLKCAAWKRDSGVPRCWQSPGSMFCKAGSHWSKRETLVERMVRIGHSADFKTQKAQIRSYSTFWCLNYPEKYRN